MKIEDVFTLITNVGFPVTLCFILIRYVLDTVGERLDKLDASLKLLTPGHSDAGGERKRFQKYGTQIRHTHCMDSTNEGSCDSGSSL